MHFWYATKEIFGIHTHLGKRLKNGHPVSLHILTNDGYVYSMSGIDMPSIYEFKATP